MLNKEDLMFSKELNAILEEYKEGGEQTTLDKNEVEVLIKILRRQLNFINDNITISEYFEEIE